MSDITIELARVMHAERLDHADDRHHHGRRGRPGRVRARVGRRSGHTSVAA